MNLVRLREVSLASLFKLLAQVVSSPPSVDEACEYVLGWSRLASQLIGLPSVRSSRALASTEGVVDVLLGKRLPDNVVSITYALGQVVWSRLRGVLPLLLPVVCYEGCCLIVGLRGGPLVANL